MSASTGDLDLGAVDGRPGGAGNRGDRADVVEVGVGEQDRVDADAELVDDVEDALGLLAGVDDQAAVGALGAGSRSSSRRPARR